MKHFANFVRLSDKNINQARIIIRGGDGKFPNNFDSQSFTRLSGFNPKEVAGTNLAYHDRVQHGIVTKELYRAATGNNPKQYFRNGSLAQKASIMPIVQNRQIPSNKREEINETTEDIVRAIANPENLSEKYGKFPLNFKAINSYVKRTNTDSERLAARTYGKTLDTYNSFVPKEYYPKESDNQKFRENYIDKMKQNDNRRKEGENIIKSMLSSNISNSASAGDKLRNKLQQREAYSKQFENPNSFVKDAALKYYENIGLMPR